MKKTIDKIKAELDALAFNDEDELQKLDALKEIRAHVDRMIEANALGVRYNWIRIDPSYSGRRVQSCICTCELCTAQNPNPREV